MGKNKENDEVTYNHQSTNIPVGSIISFAGEAASRGWLLCDGGAYRNQQYPELYLVVRTKYTKGSKHESWIIK